MKIDIIQKIYKIEEDVCIKNNRIEAWKHHILQVAKYSLLMAEKLEADKEIVEIAALLHDHASIINEELYQDEHHIHGARQADEILSELNYPREKIDLVKKCIFSHRGSKAYEKLTNEEKCVADADAMAHINHIPSLLYWAYVEKEMDTEEGVKLVSNKIERSFNKMSKEAQEIMKEKYELAQKILE
ncbi:MAG: hypothetical protein A2Y18_01080 [Clostridiales bacterium GWD2_32_19]|nr:MAG: hypothetical protein A2Y18_01080 [Clostridiales bacterium GWD2_32_19]